MTDLSSRTNFAMFEESTREDWAVIMQRITVTHEPLIRARF